MLNQDCAALRSHVSDEVQATDALVAMEKAMSRDKIVTNDRQLACAKIASLEGQNYLLLLIDPTVHNIFRI